MKNIIHVIPLNDLRDHIESQKCWCNPEFDEDGICIHHSMDQREKYETGELKYH